MDDFTLRDMIKPEASRLKIILSAIVNFAKFRDEKLAVFDEHSAKTVSNLRWLFDMKFLL